MATDTGTPSAPADVRRPVLPSRVRGYRIAVVALLVLTGLWRAVALSQWSWQVDDWLFIERTVTLDFWQYVFQIHNGHLQPGQFLVFWSITRIAPLNFAWAAAAVWLLSMASLVIWALLFRRLLGQRWAAVIGLIPVAIAPGFVPIVVWSAAGLTVYSLQLALGLTMLCSLGWVRHGSRRSLVLTAASFVLGLFLWEKSLLAVIPVLGLALLLARRPDGTLIRRRVLSLVLTLVGISAAYIALYVAVLARSGTPSSTWEMRSIGDVARFYWVAVSQNLLPALTGGPVPSATQVGTGLLIPTSAAQWVVTAVIVIVTLWGLARRRRGWIPVLTAAVYVIVSMGLVVMSSRYDFIGVLTALDPRYAADSLVVIALFGTLLLVPAVGEPDPLHEREGGPVRLPAWVGPALAGVTFLVALATSAAVWDGISPASPKPWVDNFVTGASDAGRAAVLDGTPPPNVLNGYLAGPAARLSAMISVLDLPLRWNGAAPRVLVVADNGQFRPGVVASTMHSYPVPGCGYLIAAGATVAVPVDTRMYPWEWGVEMAYTAQGPGTVRLRAAGTPVDLPVVAGEARVQGILEGGVDGPITLTNLGSTPVCAVYLTVGQLTAAPAGSS